MIMPVVSILDWIDGPKDRLHYSSLSARNMRFNSRRNFMYTPLWFSVQLAVL